MSKDADTRLVRARLFQTASFPALYVPLLALRFKRVLPGN
jgi:hypothetical protein